MKFSELELKVEIGDLNPFSIMAKFEPKGYQPFFSKFLNTACKQLEKTVDLVKLSKTAIRKSYYWKPSRTHMRRLKVGRRIFYRSTPIEERYPFGEIFTSVKSPETILALLFKPPSKDEKSNRTWEVTLSGWSRDNAEINSKLD